MANIRKDNKVLTVSEESLDGYLNQGYEQINDKGDVVQRATGGGTVSLAVHNKILDELDHLRAELEESKKKAGKKGA